MLDAALLERYAQELQRDSTRPFGEDFERTTDLERAILDEHGRDGAIFLLQRMGASPASDQSPWDVTGDDPAEDVRRVLGTLRIVLPEFYSALLDRVRWVFPVRIHDEWMLAYMTDRNLHDGRRYYEVILGGPPNSSPRLSDRAESLGWLMPQSIRKLYAVHDGLGSTDGGIPPSRNLVDLGEIMDPIAAEQHFRPRGYAFQNLLEFFPDGAGNCQAFHRHRTDDDDPPTVDWDHETREISGESPFFEFADDALSRQVLDEE